MILDQALPWILIDVVPILSVIYGIVVLNIVVSGGLTYPYFKTYK